MQPLPPQLELPAGDRFTLPTVSAVRELVPPWGPIAGSHGPKDDMRERTMGAQDREIERQMANILASFRE